jgi:ribonuclease-3
LHLQALTHRSFIEEQRTTGVSYQRLEFLGDGVLRLVAAEELYRRFPEGDEGVLSKAINTLVSKTCLAETPLSYALESLVRLGRGERESNKKGVGDRRIKLRSDLFEAWLGATYLEDGLPAARALVIQQLETTFAQAHLAPRAGDFKTTLSEACQHLWKLTPSYKDEGREGEDHAPTFFVSVTLPSKPPLQYFGRGSSKRNAQMEASRQALAQRSTWDPDNS